MYTVDDLSHITKALYNVIFTNDHSVIEATKSLLMFSILAVFTTHFNTIYPSVYQYRRGTLMEVYVVIVIG